MMLKARNAVHANADGCVCRNRLVGLVLLLVLTLPGAVTGQPSGAARNVGQLPAYEPVQTITFRADANVSMLYPAEDGQHVYFRVTEPTVNVWSILVDYIPELLWGLLILVLLVSFVRLYRVRQLNAIPYCRKCGYVLKGFKGTRCSECGAELSGGRRAIGRPVRARMVALGLMLLIGAGAYMLAQSRWVFYRRLALAVQWDSALLYDAAWVKKTFPRWRTTHRAKRDRLVLLNLRTGRRETVWHFDAHVDDWNIDPQGRVLTLFETLRITQIDLTTGQVLRTVRMERPQRIARGGYPPVEHGRDFSHVFDSGSTRVIHWDLESWTSERIWSFDREVHFATEQNYDYVEVVYLPLTDRLLISMTGGMRTLNWQVWDGPTGELGPFIETDDVAPFMGLIPSLDERTLYVGDLNANLVRGFDLASGDEVFQSPAWPNILVPRCLLDGGRYLLVDAVGGWTAPLLDLESQTWVASLILLAVEPRQIVDLPECNRVVVHSNRVAGGATEIMVFDREQLLTRD